MTKFLNANRLLGRIHVLRRITVGSKMLKIPLYKGQYEILDYVSKNPGCSQAMLAKELMISPASVALSVKRLIKANLLTKETDKNNLRCNKLYAGKNADEVINKSRSVMDEFDSNAFKNFTDEELKLFESFALRITENIVDSYFDGKLPPKHEAMAIIKKIEEEEK